MNHQRYSCFSCEDLRHWDPALHGSYSRFKHGSLVDTHVFTDHLADLVDKKLGWDFHDCLLTASAFKHIPTAAHNLTNQLWEFCDPSGRPKRMKVHRMTLSDRDYAKLEPKDRFSHTQKVKLSLDHTTPISDRNVVVIDDLYFTGAHEQNLVDLLSPFAKSITFLYLIDLNGCDDPMMESKLNHFAIGSIWDIYEIIVSNQFALNARVAKYILSYPDPGELDRFFASVSFDWLSAFRESITREGYQDLTGFTKNLQILQRNLEEVPWLSA